MKRIAGIVILFWGLLINALAVPPVLNYAGQVAVNGEAFDGNGLFKFALVNMDGNVTYWSNDGTSVDGSEPQASVSVSVNGGLYAVLLGNTAQQGMGPIDPAVFAQHTDAKLRVWFSDEVNGFQQLSPDRPFASVPYAFSAGTARNSGSATIAPDSIDRSMLSGDIRSDLNRTISHNDLSPQIKADINATIGLDRLSSEVISKLEQNATITNGSLSGRKMADRAVTASKIASNAITTNELSEQILKYLKPEITTQPQALTVYADSNVSYSVIAEGKYLTYQWKKDGVDLTGETNATLHITDANATLHDGNYSVLVRNDFGSEETAQIKVSVSMWYPALISGLKLWLDASDLSIAGVKWIDKSGNENNANKNGSPAIVTNIQNGLSAMNYLGVATDYHEWSDINDIRTVFWVIRANPTNTGWILADDNQYHFHGDTFFWNISPSGSVTNGVLNVNGTTVNGQTANMNSSLAIFSIVSLRTTGNVEASRFSKDRHENFRNWKGELGELMIYNSVLTESEISKTEGYLANKWGLTDNLPSNHPYKNKAP